MLVGLGYAAIANLVLADAVVGPLGAALVSTASTGRLVVAVSQSGLFPRVLRRMSSRGVPTRALVLNAVVGFLLLLAFRDGWAELLVARILADRGYARTLAWRSMIWLGPFYLGLLLLTLLGRFGGGLGVLPAYVDLVVVAVFALAIYEWAVRSGMPAADVAAALRTVPERVPDA